MQVTVSFTKMNGDIPRETLRKNNAPYCAVVGILISFRIAHEGFAEEGFFRGGGTSQSANKVSICDTEQDLEGKHGTGGYCNSGTKLYKTLIACLMTICFHLMFLKKVRVM